MKSVFTGMDEIKDRINRRGNSNFLKVEDGQKATIRFLQELDKQGRGYTPDRGTAYGVTEHVNPDDFSQSFVCISEDGSCYGCELVAKNSKWKAKSRILVNVLVRGTGGEKDEVKVLQMSVWKKGVIMTLISKADEDSTIVDCDFIYKREGTKFDTHYELLPRGIKPLTKEEEKLELVDLEAIPRRLSYDEQVELVKSQTDW